MPETFEIKSTLQDLELRLSKLKKALQLENMAARISTIEAKMAKTDFWNNQEAAQVLIEENKKLKRIATPLQDSERHLNDALELFELAISEDDEQVCEDITSELPELEKELAKIETQAMFSEVNDDKDVFFSIHSGAGGNDACECAEMLLRMYTRFFELRGWKTQELSFAAGEEAGIRGVTYRISGNFVYGNLRSEIGVHRIVRMSPFSGKRETSFVAIDAMPEQENIAIEIDDKDLRIDTYRSSGKGGQHVNKTDSAVRITHLPTGVVATVQNERSQHKNKAMALKILKAKIYRLEKAKRQQELGKIYGEKGEIAFGSQIRNYVFQPYTQVKDSRTGCETGDIQKVLNGYIDNFIVSYLRWKIEKQR